MDKSISAKDQTIEELVKSINSKNVWINRITLVSPGIILLIDLILKVKGITDTSLSKLLLQIVPPLCIIVPLYQLLDLHGLVIKKQQAENEPVDIPRSAISIYGRTIWDDARANIDYTKGITLLLEHGFDTLSQKLFASLVTLTATLATVEGSITACLSYLFIILVMYSLSFWSLDQMKQNKEERKMSELQTLRHLPASFLSWNSLEITCLLIICNFQKNYGINRKYYHNYYTNCTGKSKVITSKCFIIHIR